VLLCYCNLDLDPMTFIYKNGPYHVKTAQHTKNELSMSRLLKVIILHTDIYIQTDGQDIHTDTNITTPLREWLKTTIYQSMMFCDFGVPVTPPTISCINAN